MNESTAAIVVLFVVNSVQYTEHSESSLWFISTPEALNSKAFNIQT